MLLDKRLPVKFIVSKVKFELLVVTLYAISVAFLDEFIHLKGMGIPLALPGMLGTAISLIIAFRIAQSYDRWWEARKIWGAIVNDSRSLVRQSQTHVVGASTAVERQAYVSRVANLQIAWCYGLGQSLRSEDPIPMIEPYITNEVLDEITQQQNIPNAILQEQARELKLAMEKNWVNDIQAMIIDNTLMRLTDSMGKSERIKNTVFPRTYTITVELLLYLFVAMLPFGIIEFFGYLEVPLIILISMPFFYLEKTALLLQEPFSGQPTDTPVTTIAQTIEVNLKQMIKEQVPEMKVDNHEGYYVM